MSLFKILSCGNISYDRGTDRVVPLAVELRKHFNNFRIVVLGKNLDGLNIPSDKDVWLLGYIPNPDPYIIECDVLIKLSRRKNTWERDVIEAMWYGKPVLAVGNSGVCITDGIDGFLFSTFNPQSIAETIYQLHIDRKLYDRISINAKRVARLTFGPKNVRKIERIYYKVKGG